MRQLFLIITLFFSIQCFASPQTDLKLANSAYKNNDFAKATKLYESILSSGYESVEVYYNLGNSYFRQKNVAKAILNYERAKKLNSNDEDVNFNLKIANNLIADKVNVLPELIIYSWAENFVSLFDTNTWALLGITAFAISLILILLFLFSGVLLYRKLFFFIGLSMLFVSVVATASSLKSKNNIARDNSAILISPVATAKSSPNEKSTDLFIIHEGTKVYINEDLDDWSEIRLQDGNIGWVKIKDFERI